MGQIAFVVWREAVEALLVVGVLNAWLTHNAAGRAAKTARLALWTGVVAGLVLAAGLGAVLLFSNELFGDEGEDYFQAGMALGAAGLILQMVVWSQRLGHEWTAQLQQGVAEAVRRSNWVGVGLLVAAALLMTGVDRLIGLGTLPSLTPPLWDSSSLLDDGSPFGGLVSSLTGYRARPDLTQILAYCAFWVLAWLVTNRWRYATLPKTV